MLGNRVLLSIFFTNSSADELPRVLYLRFVAIILFVGRTLLFRKKRACGESVIVRCSIGMLPALSSQLPRVASLTAMKYARESLGLIPGRMCLRTVPGTSISIGRSAKS